MFPVMLIPGLVLPAIALVRFMKAVSGRRIAVIGGAQTGKTTLVTYLRDRRLPDPGTESQPVQDKFTLRFGKKDVECVVARDVPGGGGQLVPESKEAFTKADFVLYLFRADRLVAGDAESLLQVKTHLDTMKIWLDGDRFSKPRIVLVGTHEDAIEEHAGVRADPRALVASLNVIKLGRVKLGNPDVVVGSLDTAKGCAKLVQDVTEALR